MLVSLPGFEVRELFSAKQIEKRNLQLAQQIAKDYEGQEVIFVCVLKGSFVFYADLVRAISLAMEESQMDAPKIICDFIALQSYGTSMSSSGVVKITADLNTPIEGKHVVVVEDIVDTGLTMDYLLNNLSTRKPASLRVCSLLYKPARAIKKISIDYLGFTIDDLFVFGYGLDYKQFSRELPYLAFLEPLQQSLSDFQ